MINKKLAFLFVFIILVVSSISSYFIFRQNAKSGSPNFLSPLSNYQPPKTVSSVSITDEPKTEPCPLNGELMTKSQEKIWQARRPLGVMIENHVQARPQSGLSSADIVYEAVAEGGITRFLAVFYCQDAPYVGPVRSARMYFIHFLQAYGSNPLYAHVGGANTPGPANALGYLSTIGWAGNNDMNQFSVPFPYFWRDYERLPNRATEHTVYSSTAKLWEYAKTYRGLTNVDANGVSWDKNFTPWKFIDDAPMSKRGAVDKIDFGFWDQSVSDYGVTWNYDKNTNLYSRVNGGQPHIDKNTGKQLTAKDVVVMFSPESVVHDGYPDGQHLMYNTIGEGNALVFQNGQAIEATWSRTNYTDNLKFTDSATGLEIPMVRGEIFVEMLPTGNKVTY